MCDAADDVGSHSELDGLIERGSDVYIGEIHGISEVPQLFLELVEFALSDEHIEPVTVSLELQENARSLMSFAWGGQDGRHSQAMWKLVKALQVLSENHDLTVYYQLSGVEFGENSSDLRERQMGEPLQHFAKSTQLIALGGNAHSAQKPLAKGLPIPAGAYVGDEVLNIYLASVTPYSAWTCLDDGCGKQEFQPMLDSRTKEGVLVDGGVVHHDYIFFIPTATASPPYAHLY